VAGILGEGAGEGAVSLRPSLVGVSPALYRSAYEQ
jgi:hypothetical protein